MGKKYLLYTVLAFLFFWLGGSSSTVIAQEMQIFKRSDFNLRGDVKSCLVITKYGKEEFEFNEEGYLTKNTTRFSEKDYNITYYKYEGDFIKEKRDEVYIEGNFDKQTSIAHFYTIDTTANKLVIEDVQSYAGEALERYEYYYNEEGDLISIIRSNMEGVDQTDLVYSTYKGETTIEYILNGLIQKSERISIDTKSKKEIILKKQYLNGEPVKAMEEIYDENNRVISCKEFRYDKDKSSFTVEKSTIYSYDEAGMLSEEKIISGNTVKILEYIYQYDNYKESNWVKQIISPENLFKTRKITYYNLEENKSDKM